ncbi:carbon-nitrogen family hydrolase [Halorarum halobium]|uniref:carbon-nitrogen family hydrolase n=1 Tax=Halorarum halobium TaxID=3075121 RepID=UPI0028ADABB2|nr:carbon-nitrogen family hydrolase [Halobaculum sp. XH14]
MQLALVQFEPRGTVAGNREHVEERVREAAADGADLVVLPEIWNVGYFAFDRYEADAEPLDGETVSAVRSLAAEVGIPIHAGSIVERDGDDLYNTSVYVDDAGEVRATYRKMHLFGYESAENELLTPGDEVVCFETAFGTVGLATCYDLRFPALFRAMSDRGVDLLLVTSAWPLARLDHWSLLTRTRALEHQCVLAAANGVGPNEGVELGGHSCVVDPWGTPVANAGGREGTIHARVDPATVGESRAEFPTLADRRIDVRYDVGDPREGELND